MERAALVLPLSCLLRDDLRTIITPLDGLSPPPEGIRTGLHDHELPAEPRIPTPGSPDAPVLPWPSTSCIAGDPPSATEGHDIPTVYGFARDAGLAGYPVGMSTVATPESLALRELLAEHRGELDALLAKYSATNPRLFGSLARGEAGPDSDIDIIVEMDLADGNILMRASGLMDELRQFLGRPVDVFPLQLLRREISDSALTDAVAL